MKITLIVLVCIAVILGVVAYFAVFSGTQVIEPAAPSTAEQTSTGMIVLPTLSSSSASTTIAVGTPLPSSTPTATLFQSVFSVPYPVAWQEGETQISVEGASLQGNQLTLSLSLQIGTDTECVPINLRMVTDEQGDMAAPNSPVTANFPLAPDGSCNVAPNADYTSNVVFAVDPTMAPFLFTTGAPSNVFFEVSTTTDGGVQVQIPQQSG